MQHREPDTSTPTPTAYGARRAPSWVLALGAAMLLLALLLTVYGPRTVSPASTRSVGVPTAVPAAVPAARPQGPTSGN